MLQTMFLLLLPLLSSAGSLAPNAPHSKASDDSAVFCTRNGVRMLPGQKIGDSWGVKECYVREGRAAFRFVACVVDGQTVPPGHEARSGTFFRRCDIDADGRMDTPFSACATAAGERIESGEDAKQGDWFFRCVISPEGRVALKPSGCADRITGEKISPGQVFAHADTGHLMRCRLTEGGGIRYEPVGCQKDGRVLEEGEETLSQGGHFWQRCVAGGGTTQLRVVACNDAGQKLPAATVFLRQQDRGTANYWRKCVIEADGSYRIDLAACNDPTTDTLVRPGESWTEGVWVKTCEELNGRLTWKARWSGRHQ